MELLVEAGADIFHIGGPLGNGLNAPCAMGRVDAIKWLLQQGVTPVRDDAFKLASKYHRATALLTRYVEMGLAGLVNEPHINSNPKTSQPQTRQDSTPRATDVDSKAGTPNNIYQPQSSQEIQISSRPITPESIEIASGDMRARVDRSCATTLQIEPLTAPPDQKISFDETIDQSLNTEQAELVLKRSISPTTVDQDYPTDDHKSLETMQNLTSEDTFDSLPVLQHVTPPNSRSESTRENNSESSSRCQDIIPEDRSIWLELIWHIRHNTLAAEMPV
ncbi:hypothetical protein BKA64DRAFT_174493 [Cadophora sp. MPI-SDFR-AT-0126]|nr:hypothetical protein BKA64DRAFT_174493 [Leotiomycetes sp. MPI-SDFR-AT-0126]